MESQTPYYNATQSSFSTRPAIATPPLSTGGFKCEPLFIVNREDERRISAIHLAVTVDVSSEHGLRKFSKSKVISAKDKRDYQTENQENYRRRRVDVNQ
ncbi:hypothetical protein OSB04_029042 [Centaurea solstitialis]|uniref:Uncharacterized protein n=1 Tax=Centaurea solstitialis TaxID=347529 RepID=A0AA38SVA8_9ASTR|nr:hypothetical protein OSB04_029042 [Centaurea solstitialis]